MRLPIMMFGLVAVLGAGCEQSSTPGGADMATLESPADMAVAPTSDMAVLLDMAMMSGAKARAGRSLLAGGVTAKSANYKVIMSVGQSPGGNRNAASANLKLKAGLVGATQGK